MKLLAALALAATAPTVVLAAVIPQQDPLTEQRTHHGREKFLIELAPYKTRWVTEEEKWSLKLVNSC